MKKLLFKIATIAISATLTVGTLAGCGLFTVNQDRDMKQVVATVKIADNVDAEDIYKRELVAGYVSYGYQYVQSYGQTTAQAYTAVLNNLINNKVIIQQSKKELVEKYSDLLPEVTAEKIDGLKDYLFILASDADLKANEGATVAETNDKLATYYKSKKVEINSAPFMFVEEKAVYEAISSTIDSVNSLIDSVAKDEEEEEIEFETISYSARTTPSMDTDDEEETEDEIAEKIEEYKANYVKLGGTGTANFAKAFDRLKELGVIDSSETYSVKEWKTVLTLSYFKSMIKSSIEGDIVSLYEKGLKKTANIDYSEEQDEARKNEIFESLWDQYVNLQKTQEANYQGAVGSLETQLGNVGKSTFVVYDSGVGYTYVTHLVVGFDEQQKEIISDAEAEADATEESVKAKVEELVKQITATDLRASWVQSGYGTYNGQTFTFSEDYVYDTEGPLATYLGTVGRVTAYTDKNEDGENEDHLQFREVTPIDLSYNEFVGIAGQVLGGADLELGVVGRLEGYADEQRIAKTDFNKFEDLKFAFSTDEGNFNKYFGYLYSPITSAKQYVSAFNDACKAVSEQGVGAYEMFASKEYGLHIVLCTAKATYGVYENNEDGKAKFRADLDNADKESVAYLFMKANVELVTDNYISDIAQGFIYSYTAEDSEKNAVTK